MREAAKTLKPRLCCPPLSLLAGVPQSAASPLGDALIFRKVSASSPPAGQHPDGGTPGPALLHSLHSLQVRAQFGGNLKLLISGAAPLPPEVGESPLSRLHFLTVKHHLVQKMAEQVVKCEASCSLTPSSWVVSPFSWVWPGWVAYIDSWAQYWPALLRKGPLERSSEEPSGGPVSRSCTRAHGAGACCCPRAHAWCPPAACPLQLECFIRTTLCCHAGQGYGLTESCRWALRSSLLC